MKRKIWLIALISLGFIIIFLLTDSGGQLPGKVAGVASTEAILETVAPVSRTEQAYIPPVSLTDTKKEAAPEPAPLDIGSERDLKKDGMRQVYVPAGPFLMGSTDLEAKITIDGGRAYPEIPQHTVTLESYWIDKFEVTNGMFAKCVQAGQCDPPYVNDTTVTMNYYGNPTYSNYPVIWVSWYQAKDYCTWAGRRLPTEAEWEKAARGTEGQKYPWGNEPVSGERANLCDKNCPRSIANPIFDDGYADIAPVGSFPAGASPYGAMDMAGNVSEWVSSLVMPYPYDANDGRENLDSPAERVWRSSPWTNGFWWLRASVRYRSVPTYQRHVLGFRCASSE
jgi:formylglycine-generating enzyme required for sulfatase activity